MSLLQTYFLRVYSVERRKPDVDDAAAHREALFQTRLITFLPTVSLAGMALVVAGKLSPWAEALLDGYRKPISVAVVVCAIVASWLFAGHAVRKIENIPTLAARYSSPRDRLIRHIQVLCTGLLSFGFPFIVWLIWPAIFSGRAG
jgi:hypothetical protein